MHYRSCTIGDRFVVLHEIERAVVGDMEMRSVRCPCCNRMLFKGASFRVEVKCPKCGRIVRLDSERR